MHTVTYKGFLQTIRRTFPSKERAEQWARQVGVHQSASIKTYKLMKITRKNIIARINSQEIDYSAYGKVIEDTAEGWVKRLLESSGGHGQAPSPTAKLGTLAP